MKKIFICLLAAFAVLPFSSCNYNTNNSDSESFPDVSNNVASQKNSKEDISSDTDKETEKSEIENSFTIESSVSQISKDESKSENLQVNSNVNSEVNSNSNNTGNLVQRYNEELKNSIENLDGALIEFVKPENWGEPKLVYKDGEKEESFSMENYGDIYIFESDKFSSGNVYFTDGTNKYPKENETLEFDKFLVVINDKTYDYRNDSDNDGLLDFMEATAGTDENNSDTDGDGILDAYEVYNGLDPKNKDDALVDMDNDGLTNLEEYKIGTEIYNNDTDNDELFDGDEVNKYKTDPIKADTDGDGLNDGDEIKLGFDPLKADSDNNGINDNEEKIKQSVSLDIAEDELPGTVKVEVSAESSGNLEKIIDIRNIYKINVYTSGVVALVGAPVEINVSEKIDQAVITFTYDEEKIGCAEENLSIMWHNQNEEYDWFYVMDRESVIDTKNNTITITTDKLTGERGEEFMLVDGRKWYDLWKTGDVMGGPIYYGSYE